MDSSFVFLDGDERRLLQDIVRRRDPALHERLTQSSEVSRSDAELIVEKLNEEFLQHLDDQWEPTDRGRLISGVLGRFNAARIRQWP